MGPPHTSLVQALRALQSEYGYLPPEVLPELARLLGRPRYRLQEVISFFPQTFRIEPPAETEYLVCRDVSCYMAGAPAVGAELRAKHGDRAVREVHCLGRCDRAPAVAVATYKAKNCTDPVAAADRAERRARTPSAFHNPFRFERRLPGSVGAPIDERAGHTNDAAENPWAIDPYRTEEERASYRVARRIAGLEPIDRVTRIIPELETSGLRGMGGAGAPAARKWREVLRAAGGTKYVIANGDESEPGAFKDREVMLRKPHLVVEGVVLAGLMLGAERGYVFVRHEYPAQIAALRGALDALSRAFDGRLPFPIEVFESPGGYVCGEQSALIEAIEDKRAQPRPRPPDIATNGLWDCPTLLNNVETFAWVPAIVHNGGEWYRDLGHPHPKDESEPRATRAYTGKRLFSVSGDVGHPGVFEVPIGLPVGELLRLAGGLRGRELKAIAVGGASGGFVPAVLPDTRRLLDMPLDIDAFRPDKTGCRGSMLATGLIVFNETRNMAELAVNCLRFFRDESCGKCVPCRIGTQKLLQIGTGLLRPGAVPPDLEAVADADEGAHKELTGADEKRRAAMPEAATVCGSGTDPFLSLLQLAEVMEATSICALGVSAPGPLLSLLRFFPNDAR